MEEDGNGRLRQAALSALWEQSHYLAGARVPQWMVAPRRHLLTDHRAARVLAGRRRSRR